MPIIFRVHIFDFRRETEAMKMVMQPAPRFSLIYRCPEKKRGHFMISPAQRVYLYIDAMNDFDYGITFTSYAIFGQRLLRWHAAPATLIFSFYIYFLLVDLYIFISRLLYDAPALSLFSHERRGMIRLPTEKKSPAYAMPSDFAD